MWQEIPIEKFASIFVIIGGIYAFWKLMATLWLSKTTKKLKSIDITKLSAIATLNTVLIIAVLVTEFPISLVAYIGLALTQSFAYIINHNTNKIDTVLLMISWSFTAFVCSTEYAFYIVERILTSLPK